MKKFDAVSFLNSFNITIKALAESERITKDALRSLSRECLMLVHYESNKQGDISPVNQVLKVLTPRNKSAWMFFMQEFTGFHYDKAKEEFTKKDKEKYTEKCLLACEFLEGKDNDLWTWAKANLEERVKSSPIEQVGKSIERALKAEDKDHKGVKLYKPSDILKVVLEHGITTDDIIDLLKAMDVVDIAE